MGQIVIDIPTKARRHYVLTDKTRTAALLTDLEESAIRVTSDEAGPTNQQLEDLKDLRDARKAMEEYARTGVSFTVDDLRGKYGLG